MRIIRTLFKLPALIVLGLGTLLKLVGDFAVCMSGALLRIAADKKVVVNLRHLMHFDGEFKIMVMNKKKIAHNMRELVLLAGEYV